MPSRFDQRFQTYAASQQNREHGVDAVLKRGNLQTESFIARRHYERRHETLGQEIGVSVKTEQQSWLVPVSACTINGESVTPQATDTLAIGSEVWTVHAPDNGTPPVEKQAGGYYWIVHTRIETDG